MSRFNEQNDGCCCLLEGMIIGYFEISGLKRLDFWIHHGRWMKVDAIIQKAISDLIYLN